jgi:hypothetical protein
MAYCITLRSRTDTRIITGWYAGSACRRSTDHKRWKVFDNKQDARAVCDELRDLCTRNAKVINIEDAQRDPSREVGRPIFSSSV